MPLDVVNQTQGANQLDLGYVYVAPITTPAVPTVSEESYLAFKNVQCHLLDTKILQRSFVPFCQINDPASVNVMMARSPKISCSETLQPFYGHSLLFVKKSATAVNMLVNIFITAEF